MRNNLASLLISLSLMFAVTFSATAQSIPTPASGWDRVLALAPNTNVHVKADHFKATCRVAHVDADTLTCGSAVIQRTEIKSVTLPRRALSTLSGFLIAAGASLGIGLAGSRTTSFNTAAGLGLVIIILLIAGPIVGYVTDFTAHTVYKRT